MRIDGFCPKLVELAGLLGRLLWGGLLPRALHNAPAATDPERTSWR
jgi:hypothetical protein